MQLEFIVMDRTEMKEKYPDKNNGKTYLIMPETEAERISEIDSEASEIFRDLYYHVLEKAEIENRRKNNDPDRVTLNKKKISEYLIPFQNEPDNMRNEKQRDTLLADSYRVKHKTNGEITKELGKCKNMSQMFRALTDYIIDSKNDRMIPVVFYR